MSSANVRTFSTKLRDSLYEHPYHSDRLDPPLPGGRVDVSQDADFAKQSSLQLHVRRGGDRVDLPTAQCRRHVVDLAVLELGRRRGGSQTRQPRGASVVVLCRGTRGVRSVARQRWRAPGPTRPEVRLPGP